MVEEFVAITGLDAEQAQFYLEMAGFDTETALQFYYSSLDGGGGADAPPATTAAAATDDGPWTEANLKDIVFPPGSGIHEAWLVQGLALRGASDLYTPSGDWDQLGIDQPKNGPCGVVAAVLGGVIVSVLKANRLSPGVAAFQADLLESVVLILSRCKCDDGDYRLCTWASVGGVGGTVAITSAATEASLREALTRHADQYVNPGGAILLVYSAVATHGISKFQTMRDIIPLVSNYGTLQFQLCTSALMSLLLSGQPKSSLEAYDNLTGTQIEWKGQPPLMGFLSGSESELKMRIHDAYKFPENEVYVLHGRDHFTVAFEVPGSRRVIGPVDSKGHEPFEFTLVQWNGLPPAGPRCATMKVTVPEKSVRAPPTATEGVGKEYKQVVGSIDSIIQAEKDDKASFPNDWKKWKYEVALAIDDPTDVTEARPHHLPMPALYSLDPADMSNGKAWRCRSCYQVMPCEFIAATS